MRSQLFSRPAFGLTLCAGVLLAVACFPGQQAASPTPPPTAASPSPAASPLAFPSPSPAVSPAASPSPALAPGEQSHTVEAGDTLGTISEKFYGDPTLWRRIYDANRSAIGEDPDKLQVGTQLRIPPRQ